MKIKAPYTGNHAKCMHISVESSLKRLRTDYIDILYLHWWDYTTSIEEVMNALHALVLQGKVIYLVSRAVHGFVGVTLTRNATGCL